MAHRMAPALPCSETCFPWGMIEKGKMFAVTTEMTLLIVAVVLLAIIVIWLIAGRRRGL